MSWWSVTWDRAGGACGEAGWAGGGAHIRRWRWLGGSRNEEEERESICGRRGSCKCVRLSPFPPYAHGAATLLLTPACVVRAGFLGSRSMKGEYGRRARPGEGIAPIGVALWGCRGYLPRTGGNAGTGSWKGRRGAAHHRRTTRRRTAFYSAAQAAGPTHAGAAGQLPPGDSHPGRGAAGLLARGRLGTPADFLFPLDIMVIAGQK